MRRRRGESRDYVGAAIRANTQPPHTRGLGYVLDRHLRVGGCGASAPAVELGKFLPVCISIGPPAHIVAMSVVCGAPVAASPRHAMRAAR